MSTIERRWGWAAAVGVAAVLATAPGGAEAAPAPTPASSLKALVRQTSALPRTATTRTRRAKLVRTARHARRVAAKKPCTAVADLSRFRETLRAVRTKKGKRYARANRRLAALGPAAATSSRLLLSLKATKRCGGGATPTKAPAATAKVLSSDANGMSVRVDLPALRFAAREGGGKVWTQLSLPDTDTPGKPGTPAIPVTSSTLAIPEGATLDVDATKTTSYTVDGVDVLPVQPDVVDADRKEPDFTKAPYASKAFAYSASAYRAKGLQPTAPADGAVLGTSRDLKLGALQVPAAQYDPAKQRLKVITSVVVKVAFKGGSHTFSDEIASPWEAPQRRLVAGLLNAELLRRSPILTLPRCGEELLVITNTATRAAADQFATARSAAGLRTRVVETGAGAGQIGTTPAQIQTYIRGRLTALGCIHPSYVTILGDDDLVPTFTNGPSGIPSDLPYALRNAADELPDVAIGRILGNDQTAVGRAVSKIIGYETTPPTGSFLTKALVAAQFQDTDGAGQTNDGRENRTFIQFAETVRNGLAKRGVAVDRIYQDSPTTTPTQFNDGTPLPSSLLKPTFAWDGDGADVSAAWNDGRFLVVHRDHGWADGWGDPSFTTSDVNALTNGAKLPVVLSINCSSGAYDYDETSFASEALVKEAGGAVGVFGDTRDSPSWHNSQLALGFVDGLLPSVLPLEGPAAKQRTGDALITGKLRLAGIAPPSGPGISGGDGNTRNELYLWHYFGDPSMQMWGGGSPPIVFDLHRFQAVLSRAITVPNPGDPPPYQVNVTLPAELQGQPISLLRRGEVIGKALAGAGVVQIPAAFGDGSVVPGELQVAVEADGAVPVSVPVEVPAAPAPPPPPPPPPVPGPAATTLQQSCPTAVPVLQPLTVTGTLAGAPAGSVIEVTFTAPATTGGTSTTPVEPPRQVVVQAVTDASGAWTATTQPARSETGTWTVSSAYAGDADHLASSAGPCSVPVGGQPTG
ncbi:C25 family cysteine peptidase [Patulibacter sp. NPDC049589]|uniref:C25 family cysteine peptidase n=1 Tax=Patulibacter sp. NPDC049589 TaxID=3154731 RepID=UPI0034322865